MGDTTIMKNRFYVSKTDIKKGKRNDSRCCPVALCLARNIKLTFGVSVSQQTVGIDGKIYKLCEKGQRFIRNFDCGIKGEPFHLYIRNSSLRKDV